MPLKKYQGSRHCGKLRYEVKLDLGKALIALKLLIRPITGYMRNDLGDKKPNIVKEEGSYAPCTMMGMRYVTSCGWCASYAVKKP